VTKGEDNADLELSGDFLELCTLLDDEMMWAGARGEAPLTLGHIISITASQALRVGRTSAALERQWHRESYMQRLIYRIN
jgi:hypothetical protein